MLAIMLRTLSKCMGNMYPYSLDLTNGDFVVGWAVFFQAKTLMVGGYDAHSYVVYNN